ncbi:enoyl-CoA hydratase/isomerase family protein [Roseomonas sp. NAR14]|uniref:Enoyl-CoA hydratase/isomerase family protein n=1 Tax=Roseomonas acroporae TaxID=2937791 RepID=A0A9X2BXB6_9PROT|nr:enoyl-CoA hydratase/isomerase family protein [Roseomonas acroporae]MCK8784815.1 enoyl-CoA hydratase/isomerase family protein [Roseomonas acroporae]
MSESRDEAPTTLAHREDGILELTMSYPRRRNALARELREALVAHLERGMADPDCRAIILTGAGGHFCAGGDISGMSSNSGIETRNRLSWGHDLIKLLVNGDKPVIAAVEGHAAGAGLSVAAACDIVVASRAAVFTCSFNRIGLVPDLGAAWTLSRRMGLGRAKTLMLLGKSVEAAEAERLGIVDRLAEAGGALEAARALARDLAATAPLSAAMSKSLLNRALAPLEESLRAEADAQGLLFTTEDSAEGRAAFMEKRAPRFRGR